MAGNLRAPSLCSFYITEKKCSFDWPTCSEMVTKRKRETSVCSAVGAATDSQAREQLCVELAGGSGSDGPGGAASCVGKAAGARHRGVTTSQQSPGRKGCGGINLQAVFLLCICPLIKSLATKDRKKAKRKRLLFRSIHCVQIHCLVHLLL